MTLLLPFQPWYIKTKFVKEAIAGVGLCLTHCFQSSLLLISGILLYYKYRDNTLQLVTGSIAIS